MNDMNWKDSDGYLVEIRGNQVAVTSSGRTAIGCLPLSGDTMELPSGAAEMVRAKGADPKNYIWCGMPVRAGARSLIAAASAALAAEAVAAERTRIAADFARMAAEGREVVDGWIKSQVHVGDRTVEIVWINAAGEKRVTHTENH